MIIFLLCAYNEEKSISTVLKDIITNFKSCKIVCVNDGSTDSTEQVIRKISHTIEIISHTKNEGLGRALKTGFEHIMSTLSDNDVVITLDADNTHPIKYIHQMNNLLHSNADIIIGSRYCYGGKEYGVRFIRKVLSRGLNLFLRMLFCYRITDYSSGFRTFKGSILLKAKQKYKNNLIQKRNFAATAELLLKLLPLKPVIREVDIELRYDLKAGRSKIKILRTIFDYITLISSLKLKQTFQ